MLDFINLDILSICTSSDTFEIIPIAVEINTIGIIKTSNIFDIKFIKKSIIGSITPAEVILPVVKSKVISKGTSV